MGRVGHVRISPPEYGSCITDWAQDALYHFLVEFDLQVLAPDEDCEVEDANHWEIEIPEREQRDESGKVVKYFYDYALVREAISYLREHPDAISLHGGSSVGEEAADLLEEGLEAAERNKDGYIIIDWW